MSNKEKPVFAMSMFASRADLYKAKAEHFEGVAMAAEVARDIAKDDVEWLEQRVSELEAKVAAFEKADSNRQSYPDSM